jgi:hypothetical protein
MKPGFAVRNAGMCDGEGAHVSSIIHRQMDTGLLSSSRIPCEVTDYSNIQSLGVTVR